MTPGFFLPFVRACSIFKPLAGAVQSCHLPSPCSKLRTFSNLLQDECVCVYASVCRCDVNCDPMRMDKWQKMWFFPSHLPLPSPLFQRAMLRGRQQWRRICVSVGLSDAPADPPPLSLWAGGPQGELAPDDASLSQHWQAKSGHSPTEPRGDGAVEKPPDLSATHSVRELSVSGTQHHRKGLKLKG